jgi:small-conductance mechanosensitive channel
VDVNSLVVSLGVGSLAVGLAAQDTLANMFAGFTLMLDRLSRPTRILTTRVEVGVAYGSDPAVVKRILRESALVSPRVEPEREPMVLLQRFGDFSLQYLLVFWVRDYTEQGPCRSEVLEEIHRRLAEAGIEIPFPVWRVIQEMRVPGEAGGDA